MKILIDIDELEKNGTVSNELAKMLRVHAVRETGASAINTLLAFGAIAVAIGLLTLLPSSGFAAFFGVAFVFLGWLIKQRNSMQWANLASIWMVTGSLISSGAIGVIINQPILAPLIAGLIFAGVGVLAESKLLIALVPMSLAAAIGGSTGYWHACYAISVQEPTLTIIFFSLLAYGSWQFAKLQHGMAQDLAIVFARMCVILVNLGFWVGSLWGDTPGEIWKNSDMGFYNHSGNPEISGFLFVIGWALALLCIGGWGAKNGRRFIVNTVAVFGAIHFYTQWFENLGLHAITVIIAGIATIVFALGFMRYNRKVLVESRDI